VGAGLMIRSLAELWNVDPGFNSHNVLTFDVSMAPSLGTSAATSRAAIRELGERLEKIPGVESVSLTAGALPMTGDNEIPFWIEGQAKPANVSEMNSALTYFVGPGYLKAMQIQLLRGRFFTASDDEHAPMVAVVDENFARKYFPGQDPIGKRLHLAFIKMDPEIIGVVAHVKHWGLDYEAERQAIQEEYYAPFVQIPDEFWIGPPGAQAVLRSAGNPLGMTGAVRDVVTKLNGENVTFEMRTMDAIIAENLAARRFSMILLSVFAVLALLLSSLGIYGVISYVVGERTREIGIRIALGAQRRDVLRLMLGEGTKMTLLGIGIGLVAAAGLMRLMTQVIYGVGATDPVTFGAVVIVLSLVALAACYVPARRAMRVDPLTALRHE